MKLPSLKNSSFKKHITTTISGTVTAHDPLGLNSDKLSECNNLWNSEGILTTRPAFFKENGVIIAGGYPTDDQKAFFADFPFTMVGGYNSLFAVAKEVYFDRTDIWFYAINDKGDTKHLFTLEIVAPNGHFGYEIKNMLFIKDKALNGCGIFIIIPTKSTTFTSDEVITQVKYYEMKSDCSGVINIPPSDFYHPLIMKHGHGNNYSINIEPAIKDTVYPEGVNILGGGFEADFSCDDASYMFTLPVAISKDSAVNIEYYTSTQQKRSFTIYSSSDYSEEQDFLNIKLKFRVNRAAGTITALANGENYPLPRLRRDNSLRIFAYTDTSKEAYELLSRRIKPLSFDCRLFLSGGEKNGDRVYYSGKNEHLYFSEANSFNVGDDRGDVTALSQQNRYIIAFKEKEIYRITLEETAEIDRDTLRDDDLITTTPKPSKKIVRVTNHIGCDRPRTIKTCGNRLVWYHSDGAVYTLYGSNLYTEGSVYELSADIKDTLALLSEEENQKIFAVTVNGYYGLATGNKIFIMDCLVSGFTYLSGHKSADKKYSGLSWFFWETPEGTMLIDSFVKAGKTLFIMADTNTVCVYLSGLSGETDIIYDNKANPVTVKPRFSFATALLGNENSKIREITVRAMLCGNATLTVFDENTDICSFDITGKNRYCNYVIPMSAKVGRIGIRINGKGAFRLSNIIIENTER